MFKASKELAHTLALSFFHLGNVILAFPPVLLKNTAANLTALISGDIHGKGPQSHHKLILLAPVQTPSQQGHPCPGSTRSRQMKPVLLLPF